MAMMGIKVSCDDGGTWILVEKPSYEIRVVGVALRAVCREDSYFFFYKVLTPIV